MYLWFTLPLLLHTHNSERERERDNDCVKVQSAAFEHGEQEFHMLVYKVQFLECILCMCSVHVCVSVLLCVHMLS